MPDTRRPVGARPVLRATIALGLSALVAACGGSTRLGVALAIVAVGVVDLGRLGRVVPIGLAERRGEPVAIGSTLAGAGRAARYADGRTVIRGGVRRGIGDPHRVHALWVRGPAGLGWLVLAGDRPIAGWRAHRRSRGHRPHHAADTTTAKFVSSTGTVVALERMPGPVDLALCD